MPSRRRIALFYYVVTRDNGIGRCNRAILEGLCDKYDFTVYSVRFDNPRPDRIRWVRIRCPLRPLFALYLLFYLTASMTYLWQRMVGGERYDVVQCSDNSIGFATLAYVHFCHRFYLRRWMGIKDLLSVRGIARGLDHLVQALFEGSVYRRARAVVVPSRGLRRELSAVLKVTSEAMTVLPIPIDSARYSPDQERADDQRAELGLASADFVLIFMALGDLDRKGLGPTLEALARPSLAGARLLILGATGGAIAPFRARTDALGLSERVIFCGRPADVRPFLLAADAFILPSRYEVFPMVALEAAACGLPLITTRLNGVEEFAVTGVTGILLEDVSAAAIAEGIKHMMNLPRQEIRQMGQNARSAVLRYGLSEFLEGWAKVYSTMLAA